MTKTILKDNDIEITTMGEPGVALVWVIDGDCLYDIPLKNEYFDIFLSSNTIEDVSIDYPEHEGIVVRFTKDDNVYDFLTSEYFGSILLSEPLVLNLGDYPYGRYVISPHAKFDGEKFIILNRDTTDLMPWHPRSEKK